MLKFNLLEKDRNPQVCTQYECGSFLSEFAEEYPMPDDYNYKGVWADAEGKELRLSYDGLLAKSGAQDVYAVVSYGDNKKWKSVKYYPMGKTEFDTFEAILPFKKQSSLNIAFKDGADNWDNNSGNNYRFVEF